VSRLSFVFGFHRSVAERRRPGLASSLKPNRLARCSSQQVPVTCASAPYGNQYHQYLTRSTQWQPASIGRAHVEGCAFSALYDSDCPQLTTLHTCGCCFLIRTSPHVWRESCIHTKIKVDIYFVIYDKLCPYLGVSQQNVHYL
jgi:hypothetical protein